MSLTYELRTKVFCCLVKRRIITENPLSKFDVENRGRNNGQSTNMTSQILPLSIQNVVIIEMTSHFFRFKNWITVW